MTIDGDKYPSTSYSLTTLAFEMTSLDLPSSSVFFSFVVSMPLSIQKECLIRDAVLNRERGVVYICFWSLFAELAILSQRLDERRCSLGMRREWRLYVHGVRIMLSYVRIQKLRLLIQSSDLFIHGVRSLWRVIKRFERAVFLVPCFAIAAIQIESYPRERMEAEVKSNQAETVGCSCILDKT